MRLLALGPNPAVQKVIAFDAPLELGGVNRAASVGTYVGGKGQGVALALQRWAPGASAVAHFIGGDGGGFVEAAVAAAGLEQIVSRTAAATRTCTTLLPGSTEVIEPSGEVSEAELRALLDGIGARLGDFGGVALCGTTPPGAAALYGELCGALQARPESEGLTLLLDGFKQTEAALGSGRVDVLKLNVDEAKALTGEPSAAAAAEQLLRGPRAVLTRRGALLALTDGPRPALLYTAEGPAYRLTPPKLEHVVNAIGAGDVCTAVFLHELCAARAAAGGGPCAAADAADAFAMGLAAASARCGHETPAFKRAEAEALRVQVVVEVM